MIEIALTVLIYVVAGVVFFGGIIWIASKVSSPPSTYQDYLQSTLSEPVMWTKTTTTTYPVKKQKEKAEETSGKETL